MNATVHEKHDKTELRRQEVTTTGVDSTDGVSPAASSPDVVAFRSSKLRESHKERLAIVYIRQSSPHQVLENRESRERQYALAKVAQQWGWPPDRVVIIDDDQGVSGKSAANRGGFQRLLSEVSLNHVGLVLALELNRLSRSSKDWHHLVEVCAVFNTLLADQDGLYDATDSNDRLLLGMKGAMSEFELITLRNRLQRGLDNKAARGDLFLHLPVGYLKSSAGEVLQEPDEQARGVVQLIFEKFAELGSVWSVYRYLLRNKIQLGFRCRSGPRRGQLEWRRPTERQILAVLRHPIYAGAYAFGMHRPGRKNPVSGQVEGGKFFLSPDEIRVLIRDRVPAYISWEQYLANQQRIDENRSLPTTPGTPRRGEALLSGLVVCGRCERRMEVNYQGGKKPRYLCSSHLHEANAQPCGGLKSSPLDELVAQQVLRALKPAAVELSLQAAVDVERERARLHEHWRQRLERAQYEVQRAERQYQSVEPENRLVARTLEQRWEEALRQERQLREDYDRFQAETPATLSEADQQRLRAASRDISTLWHAAETVPEDRKAIVRCLVEQVVVRVDPRSEYVDAMIHWHGGFTSQHQVVRPVSGYSQLRDYDLLIARIKQLHQEGHTIPAIGERLNQEGFVPPRRRGKFTVGALARLIKNLGLKGELGRDDLLGPDEWWLGDLATELKMNKNRIYSWAQKGWVHARATPSGQHWIIWADADELCRLRKLQAQRYHIARQNPQLVTPKPRKD